MPAKILIAELRRSLLGISVELSTERDAASPLGLKENQIWDTITSQIYAETAKDCGKLFSGKAADQKGKEAMAS
jgi:hypothetical protein